jgi:hypothetical protein
LGPEGPPDIHQKVEDFLKRKSRPELAQADGVDEAANILPSLKAALSADLILNILRNSPSGLTAREVADQLGGTRSNIGSRLSKFAAYGIIKQNRRRTAATVSSGAIYTLPMMPEDAEEANGRGPRQAVEIGAVSFDDLEGAH